MENQNQNVVVSKTFEEKMADKIKEQIGDLIDDEALFKLVEKGIQLTFFEPRTTYDRWNSPTTKPCLMSEVVKELLTERIKDAASKVLDERADEIQGMVKEVLTAGAGQILMRAISDKFAMDLQMLEVNIGQRLRGG